MTFTSDGWALALVQAFVGQAVGYFAFVGLVFLVVWRWGARRFASARIPGKHRFNAKQWRHEVKHTLLNLALGTLTAAVVSLLYANGNTRLTADPTAVGPLQVAVTFVGLIVFNDAWFYGWHRLLHHRSIYRLVHGVHHHSVDVNPFSSYSFHVLEGFILGAWIIPVSMVLPIYLPMLGALQAVGMLNNVVSHLGYEFMPRWFIRVPPFRWLSSATYHSLHHTRLNGNYGLFFRFWDRLLKTEVPDYEHQFVTRGGSAENRGSPTEAVGEQPG